MLPCLDRVSRLSANLQYNLETLNSTHTSFSHLIHTHRADMIALLLAIAGFLTSALVTQRVFEAVPHIEDEIAYVWQAKAMVEGHLTIPSPTPNRSFLVPFVVDYQGERFGKYPPGWPALLSIAIRMGATRMDQSTVSRAGGVADLSIG